jgi:hypothetical protein
MARIRTVKPDFWEDETVAALSPMARLLFIGSWNLADDEGILRWTPDYINASLFMYDNLSAAKVRKLMDEVVATERVFEYSAGKARQTLGYVVNFRKHQRINRPQPSRLPPPSLQNPATLMMYARRDDWTCHLCKGPINPKLAPKYDGYDNGMHDFVLKEHGDWHFNMSPDHLVPRSKGGSDYPSNIGASHVSCNKGRGARPIPEGVPDSLNDDVNDSPPEGNGGGKGMEHGTGKDIAPAPAAAEKPGRPPDVLWDSMLAACGIREAPTASARGAYNRARKDLADVGATPEEIHRRADIHRLKWPDISITPSSLARHWAECAQPPTHTPNGGRPAPLTTVERSLQTIREGNEQRRDQSGPGRDGHILATARALEAGA